MPHDCNRRDTHRLTHRRDCGASLATSGLLPGRDPGEGDVFGRIWLRHSKTRSSVRDVPMSEPVRAALLAHRRLCAEPDAAALVFTSRAGTPMGPKNLANRVLRPTCVKLGLRPISWHVLRHYADLLTIPGEPWIESLRSLNAEVRVHMLMVHPA